MLTTATSGNKRFGRLRYLGLGTWTRAANQHFVTRLRYVGWTGDRHFWNYVFGRLKYLSLGTRAEADNHHFWK